MAIQPHSRIESQLTDPTYKGPYLSRIELILKDMLENYGRIAFVGPYDSLEDLPETGQAGYVYLVRVEGSNLCDEYIWDEQEEEYNYVGRFEIDLDDYQTKDLSNPITIDSVVYTTVETALAAMNVSLSNVSRDALKKVSAMPQNPSNNDLVVWHGNNTYKVGHTYKYVEGTGETLYAWQVDNPGGVGDGTVIYTKSAIPNEDTNIYKSDGTAYSSSTDDPTYELMVGGESAITIEIFSLSQMQSWERSALRKSSDDIVATSGEWVEVTKDNVQDDWEQSDSSAPDYIKNKPTLGTAASRNATNQITEGSTALPEAGAVKTALDGKISKSNIPGLVKNDGTIDQTQYEKSGVAGTLVKDTVGWSGKNRFNNTGWEKANVHGILFTPRDDGTILINGQNDGTSQSVYWIMTTPYTPQEQEILSGLPEQFSDVNWGGANIGYAISDVVLSVNNSYTIALIVDVGASVDNVVVRPMIRSASIEDSTFEPYHATVDTVKADKVANATSGHLAGLDSNGNLTDSGVSPTEDVTVEGNPVTFDSPFEQDAKSVVVTAKPIQDLHGYDHPWPAGGGKNKWSLSNSYTSTSHGDWVQTNTPFVLPAGQYTVSYTDASSGQNAEFYILDASDNLITDFVIVSNGARCYSTITLSTDSAKLAICMYGDARTISDIQIESGSTPTSFAPYSNICPISGIDEVEIGVSGKNLVFTKLPNANINSSGQIISGQSGYDMVCAKVIRGQTYTITTDDISGFVGGFFVTEPDYDSVSYNATRIVTVDKTFTAPIDGYVAFRTLENYAYAQCELGTEATDYEPYNPNSHTTTIPLPSTLYDADVDVTEGSGNSTHAIVDLGDLEWTRITTNVYRAIHSGIKVNGDSEIADLKCEIFYPSYYMYLPEGSIATRSGDEIWVRTFTDDLTEFENLVNGYKLVYPLATPTTISFDPTDVELLEGTNVVSTNGEKVAVTYKAGILATLGDIDDLNDKVKTKLDKKDVAKVEGVNASKPYSVGDYMLRSDGFYRVTASIASGASITSNNTTKVTVGGELANKVNTDDSRLSDARMPSNNNSLLHTSGNEGYISGTKYFMNGNIAMAVDQFSASNTYEVGSYTVYQGQLYKCTVRHFESDWDSSHFAISSNIIVANGTIAAGTYETIGSDYAENFETLENCPVCRFVTLDGEKIRLAQPNDYILGVTSESPSVIGDSMKQGISVGLLGKLWVEHDGSAEINGYVISGENGIAIKSDKGYRVMAVDGNKCKVLVK